MDAACLATDCDGAVASSTLGALVKLKRSGRRFVRVTGRHAVDTVELRKGRDQVGKLPGKDAEGELGEDKSFDFRGPDDAHNVRAQNLRIFLQMADGVGGETWRHPLKSHDGSRWIREAIKDGARAGEAQQVENADHDPMESRHAIREAVGRRYTAPAATGAVFR